MVKTYDKESIIKVTENNIRKLIADLKLTDTVSQEHLMETPMRMSKMLVNEFFASCYDPAPKMTTFSNTDSKCEIIVENMTCNSTCAHHFVPFTGYASICYAPNKKVVGLSKFGRVISYFCKRPQIQEVLTNQIKDYIVKSLDPTYLIIVLKCRHECMNIRGVEDANAYTTTSALYNPKNYDLTSKVQGIINNLKKPL